ncbi:hypothetical protein OH492_08505 [Vibrio chagasii]|nr:hypothetical protein [Vibrio chagasii]
MTCGNICKWIVIPANLRVQWAQYRLKPGLPTVAQDDAMAVESVKRLLHRFGDIRTDSTVTSGLMLENLLKHE